MFDVTRISYTPGDVLIFAMDMDTYDMEEIAQLGDEFKNKMPDAKILFVPDDLIEEVLVLNKQFLAYDTNTVTITSPSGYPPAYLTNICSDSTTATVRLDNEGESKLW